MNLKQQIQQAQKEKDEASRKLARLMIACTHEKIKKSYASAVCDTCGRDFGWFCPKSSDNACEYNWETHGEDCIYCGQPEERK